MRDVESAYLNPGDDMAQLELGLDTFGDVTFGDDGSPLPYDQVIRNIVDQAVLADELGLAFFGVGGDVGTDVERGTRRLGDGEVQRRSHRAILAHPRSNCCGHK